MEHKPPFAVIAGNYDQFRNYVFKKGLKGSSLWDYFYVSRLADLLGRHGVNFEFVGTWYERNDIPDIGERLWMCNVGTPWEHKTKKFLNY